jgi:hypothetical protein
VTGKDEPVAAREPTVVEGTPFPTPFRLAPLIVSERFAAAASMLQQPGAQVPDFDGQLDDVIALIGGKFETDNGVHLSATPGEGARVELWLVGSSLFVGSRAAAHVCLAFSSVVRLRISSIDRQPITPTPTSSVPAGCINSQALAAGANSWCRKSAVIHL